MTPPKMLNFLSPNSLSLCFNKIGAFRVYTKTRNWVYILTQDIQHFWWCENIIIKIKTQICTSKSSCIFVKDTNEKEKQNTRIVIAECHFKK